MPTSNRRVFVAQSIRYFLRQDYPRRELVILDDGDDSIEDLVPVDDRIRYHRTAPGQSLGQKRNEACQLTSGDIIAHWDDDDWYAPHRLSAHVEAMQRTGADISGMNQLFFYDYVARRSWLLSLQHYDWWVSGSSLTYRRQLWKRKPFRDVAVAEDGYFVRDHRGCAICVLRKDAHVAINHTCNTCLRQTRGRFWRNYPANRVRQLLGDDLTFYDAIPVVAAKPAVQGYWLGNP
jgi:glycosyltransferase involved in cell wall biosynthesis